MKRKVILILILSGYSLMVSALSIDSTRTNLKEMKFGHIYRYERELTSCVDNVDKLFATWPTDIITNSNEIEFISYTAYPAIKDTCEVEYYATIMSTWDTPCRSLLDGSTGIRDGEYFYHLLLEISTPRELVKKAKNAKRRKTLRKYYETSLADNREFIMNTAKIGDRVFSLKFRYRGKEMTSYIICDHESYRVIVDFIFQGV